MKEKLLLLATLLGILASALPSQAISPGQCTRQPVCDRYCPTVADPETAYCCCPSGTPSAGYVATCEDWSAGECNQDPCGVFVPPTACRL